MNLKYQILIIDDVADNIQVAMNILDKDDYEFSFAVSGEAAYELLLNNDFDLLLLDIAMPGMSGFDLCRLIKQNSSLKEVPLIFLVEERDVALVSECFQLGCIDYIVKPFCAKELASRVENSLQLYSAKKILKYHNIGLERKIKPERECLLTELEKIDREMIYTLAGLMESFLEERGAHVRRVAEISKLLAHYHQNLDDEDEDLLYYAAPMHDIGKIVIPFEILLKENSLVPEEREIIKMHTVKAKELLKNSSEKIMKTAAVIAYEHHEKWDGSGYPRGLKGEEINIFGRIVAVADVFDTLRHPRVYADAWDREKSAAYIIEESGREFDPAVVSIFKEHLNEFLEIV